jgi:hypothetical protein
VSEQKQSWICVGTRVKMNLSLVTYCGMTTPRSGKIIDVFNDVDECGGIDTRISINTMICVRFDDNTDENGEINSYLSNYGISRKAYCKKHCFLFTISQFVSGAMPEKPWLFTEFNIGL